MLVMQGGLKKYTVIK